MLPASGSRVLHRSRCFAPFRQRPTLTLVRESKLAGHDHTSVRLLLARGNYGRTLTVVRNTDFGKRLLKHLFAKRPNRVFVRSLSRNEKGHNQKKPDI
jgi:hypothetical protein